MVSPHFSYRALGIIVHPKGDQILAFREPEGWSLPSIAWETPAYAHWTDVTLLNPEMSRHVGRELTTLQCLSNTYHHETNCFSRVYVMEFQSSLFSAQASAQWIDISALRILVPSEHRSRIETWLASWDTHAAQSPPVPWSRPGWLARITTWIEQQMEQKGGRVVDAPEQLRVGERGSLLRVKTTQGIVYLKALPAFFAHELSLLAYLAPHYPSFLPTLIAIETQSHSMLLRDFGGVLLSQSKNLCDVEEALRRYAALQIDQVEHIQQLRALGCPYLPTEALTKTLDDLLADAPSLLMNVPGGLSEEDVLRLHSLRPILQDMCQQLAESPIPPSLEHGDFHDENIAMTNRHPLYFDWTDSCIAHPFFSLYPFLLTIEPRWPHMASLRQHVRDVYLQPWEHYAPREQLITLFELAQKLAPLYLVSLYSSLIIPRMEAKWEMQYGVLNNLHILLERMHNETASP